MVTNGTQVVIDGGETWAVNQLVVATNATIQCQASNNTSQVNGQWVGVGVVIQAQSVAINAGGVVSADGLGYASGQGPGAGVRYSWAGGGGYGGAGGAVNAGGGATYGSLTQPVDLGSGGSDSGNPGGGAIHFIVGGTLQVDGTITADGVHTANDGGGAGGSIFIEAGNIAGTGMIQANGAQGGNDNGGGGGRIAVDYQTKSFAGITTRGRVTRRPTRADGWCRDDLLAGCFGARWASVLDNNGQVGAYAPGGLDGGDEISWSS